MAVGAAVAGVASAVVNSKAAGKAASAQEQAAQNQTTLAQQGATQESSNLSGYRDAGNTALQTLQTGSQPGGQFNQDLTETAAQEFSTSPGYTASVAAGQDAIMAQAARSGRTLSPATLGALGQYTANAATQNYNTVYGQLFGQEQLALGEQETLVGVGQNATQQTNQAIAQSTGQQISAQGSIGNARAANDVAQGQAISSGINSVASAYGTYMTGGYGGGIPNSSSVSTNSSNPNSALNSNYFTPQAAAQQPLQYDANGNIT